MRITKGGGYLTRISKTITLDGTNNLGELDQPTVTIFTVTGEVQILSLVPFCTVDLTSAGGGTLALGVVGATTLFLGATTATAIDANEFWIDATTPAPNGIALPAAFKDIVITDNIVATVATADITAGAIRFDCYYLPLSANGALS